MSRDDWFRRTAWSEEDERAFFARLARSHGIFRKAQYLRIQAVTLAETRNRELTPAALTLLERLFAEFPDSSQLALAYLQAAECCDALDRIHEALRYFRLSLDAQSRFPSIDPGTNLEYPWFIVSRGLVDLYGEALDVLERYRGVFPAQWFKAAAIRALIAEHNGERDQASQYASDALEAASQKQSSFRYHPSLGLVGQGHNGIIERLRHIAAGVA